MPKEQIVAVGCKRSTAEKKFGPESLKLGSFLICADCQDQVIFSIRSLALLTQTAEESGSEVVPLCLECAVKISPENISEVVAMIDPKVQKAIAKERAEAN